MSSFSPKTFYLLSLGLLSLSACTPRYSCKGFPDKRACLSATEAYRATESKDVLDDTSEDGDTLAGLSPVRLQPDPERVTAAPYRSAPRVLKIWMAPYEDAEGDLHLPGTVYTELETRRWMLGQPVPKGAPILKPLHAGGVSTSKPTRSSSPST